MYLDGFIGLIQRMFLINPNNTLQCILPLVLISLCLTATVSNTKGNKTVLGNILGLHSSVNLWHAHSQRSYYCRQIYSSGRGISQYGFFNITRLLEFIVCQFWILCSIFYYFIMHLVIYWVYINDEILFRMFLTI
jgi:hypothetical protein